MDTCPARAVHSLLAMWVHWEAATPVSPLFGRVDDSSRVRLLMYLAPACLSGAFRSSVSAGVYNMNQAGWRKELQFTSGVSPDTMLGCLTTLLASVASLVLSSRFQAHTPPLFSCTCSFVCPSDTRLTAAWLLMATREPCLERLLPFNVSTCPGPGWLHGDVSGVFGS